MRNIKTLLLLITLIITVSCSRTDDNDTNCLKEYYEIQTSIWFDAQNNPHTTVEHVLIYSEPTNDTNVGVTYTDDYEYFKITCE